MKSNKTSEIRNADLNISLVYLRRWTKLIGIEAAIEKTREFAERLRALQ